jgi:putative transposase
LTDWARILAYVTGTVDQELLARNEYLAAENGILKAQLNGRLKLSDGERATLGEIGHRLGSKALGEVANAALPLQGSSLPSCLISGPSDGDIARPWAT